MGADMVTLTLCRSVDEAISWTAAARAIRAVNVDALWGTGDDLFPLEAWIDEYERASDMDAFPGAECAFALLSAAQRDLHRWCQLFRGALELGWPEELIDVEVAGQRLLVTGGPSWGESPGDLIDPLIYLSEAGVLEASGFSVSEQYASVRLADRDLNLDSWGRRQANFGATVARLLDVALSSETNHETSALRRLDSLIGLLAPDGRDTDQLPSLVQFAAGAIALAAWLRDPGQRSTDGLFQAAAELARLADEDGLRMPKRRSARAAVRQVRREALELRYWAWAIDDPEVQTDEAVRDFVARAGPLGEGVAVELSGPLYIAIAAIVDLGFDWSQDSELAPRVVSPADPQPSQVRLAPLVQYLSLALFAVIDWGAAERLAAERLRGSRHRKAIEDIEDLRSFIDERSYDRYAAVEDAHGNVLVIGSPESDGRPEVAHAIGRLGRDGLLDAAGALWWTAPDPAYAGPVQTFVRGYGPVPRPSANGVVPETDVRAKQGTATVLNIVLISGMADCLADVLTVLRPDDSADPVDFSLAVPEPPGRDEVALREWRQQHWGTPAAPHEVSFWGEPGGGELRLRFRTEMSPPEKWLEEVSKRCPQAAFDLVYQADDHEFAGRTAWRHGELAAYDWFDPSLDYDLPQELIPMMDAMPGELSLSDAATYTRPIEFAVDVLDSWMDALEPDREALFDVAVWLYDVGHGDDPPPWPVYYGPTTDWVLARPGSNAADWLRTSMKRTFEIAAERGPRRGTTGRVELRLHVRAFPDTARGWYQMPPVADPQDAQAASTRRSRS